MEINANDIIEHLSKQVAQQAKEIAFLKAQIDKLLEENEALKKKGK
jgi:hypothetical protein